jgi:hypothetical protein
LENIRPGRSKQEFRALRELVGVTQQAMADRLGVKILSVKRWESPKYPQQAPYDAWDLLDSLESRQYDICRDAAGSINPKAVDAILPYWSSAGEWETMHPGHDLTWTEANATSRRLASVLFAQGMDVRFSEEAESNVRLFA